MAYVRLDTRGAPPEEWEGELAAEETTRTEDRQRWVEFRVYRLDDGWLAHRAGMSVVYHRANTTCRTASRRKPGAPATVADLPDDAEPCEVCQPPYPDLLGDDEQVRFEFPRDTVDRAADAAGLVHKLTTYRERPTGTRVTRVSEPVAALLMKLATEYPEFNQVMWPQTAVAGPMTQGDDGE